VKLRSGFVSNSSSSSFFVLATEDAHNRAMAELSVDEQKCIRAVLEQTKAFGQNMVFVSELSVHDSSTFDYVSVDSDCAVSDAVDAWQKLVTKDSKNGISIGVDDG